MYDSRNNDLGLLNSIDDAIAIGEELANRWIVELRHLATLLRKIREIASQVNDSPDHGLLRRKESQPL